MLLPRKWVLSLGLLAAAPGVTLAGPFDFLKGGSETADAAQASAPRGNQEVAEDIAKALRKAKLVGRNIEIEYQNGVATIKGEVADAQHRINAVRAAESVDGVDTVNAQLRVMKESSAPAGLPRKPEIQQAAFEGQSGDRVQQVSHSDPAARSNQAVAQNIADAMVTAGLSGYDIEIRYKNGIASLIGSVEAKEQAAHAQRVAQAVPGVQQVLNRLTVNGRPVSGTQTAAAPYSPAPQQGVVPTGYPAGPSGYPIQQVQANPPGAMGMPGPPMSPPGLPAGAGYGQPIQPAGHLMHNQPRLPQHAWPSYAQYDNYAAVTYPNSYDASAWPYIGPFYPYPQVPLGWRSAQLVWDDGYWNLKFNSRTDKWWWFLNPHNWD
ncbi:BON domain-containing protein [Maioricimonas sp. JC845]|uniref:BON domain-containing protein n=1 Tax=Maioricimonas sp. JC845 TaxID=3232138 RepID=UPI00345B0462